MLVKGFCVKAFISAGAVKGFCVYKIQRHATKNAGAVKGGSKGGATLAESITRSPRPLLLPYAGRERGATLAESDSRKRGE